MPLRHPHPSGSRPAVYRAFLLGALAGFYLGSTVASTVARCATRRAAQRRRRGLSPNWPTRPAPCSGPSRRVGLEHAPARRLGTQWALLRQPDRPHRHDRAALWPSTRVPSVRSAGTATPRRGSACCASIGDNGLRSCVVLTGDAHVNYVVRPQARLRRRAGRARRDRAVRHVRHLHWPSAERTSTRSCARTRTSASATAPTAATWCVDVTAGALDRPLRVVDEATRPGDRRGNPRPPSSSRRVRPGAEPLREPARAEAKADIAARMRRSSFGSQSGAAGLDVRRSRSAASSRTRDVAALFRIVGVVAGVSHEMIGAPPQLADEHLGTASGCPARTAGDVSGIRRRGRRSWSPVGSSLCTEAGTCVAALRGLDRRRRRRHERDGERTKRDRAASRRRRTAERPARRREPDEDGRSEQERQPCEARGSPREERDD